MATFQLLVVEDSQGVLNQARTEPDTWVEPSTRQLGSLLTRMNSAPQWDSNRQLLGASDLKSNDCNNSATESNCMFVLLGGQTVIILAPVWILFTLVKIRNTNSKCCEFIYGTFVYIHCFWEEGVFRGLILWSIPYIMSMVIWEHTAKNNFWTNTSS